MQWSTALEPHRETTTKISHVHELRQHHQPMKKQHQAFEKRTDLENTNMVIASGSNIPTIANAATNTFYINATNVTERHTVKNRVQKPKLC